jgi:hypothetical protein
MHTFKEQTFFESNNIQVLFSLPHKHTNETELNLTMNRGGEFAAKRT